MLGVGDSCVRLLDSSAGEGSGPEHDSEEHEPKPERRDWRHEVLLCDQSQRLNRHSDASGGWQGCWAAAAQSMPMPSNDEGVGRSRLGSVPELARISITYQQRA